MTVPEPALGSPGALKALLTFVVACFSLITFARSHEWIRTYPYFSFGDPVRAIFLRAEFERHVAQAWPAWLGESEAFDDASAAWRELAREGMRASQAGLAEANVTAEHAAVGARVMVAGFGHPEAVASVRAMPGGDLPGYLGKRVREIQNNDESADSARRVVAVRWEIGGAVLSYLGLGGGVLSLGFLARRRNWRSLPTAERPFVFGLASAFVVLSWSFAALAVTWRLLWTGAPFFGDLARWFGYGFAALVALALVHDERTSGSRLALQSLFRLPADRRERNAWLSLAWLVLGADLAFAWLVDLTLRALGGSSYWNESFVESILYGSGFEAFMGTLDLVLFGPLAEEILFRGVLFGALLGRLSTHWAALVSAIVFAAWHSYGVPGSIIVGVGGYLWARLYAATGSLVPGLLVHSAMNVMACLWNFGWRA